MANIVKPSSDKLKQMIEEDSKPVKGKFNCHDPKGGSITFSYRKYRGEPMMSYTLNDGETYTLPLGVVRHLNNCGKEICSHLLDSEGKPFVGIGKKDLRFTFQDTSFC